ncbi:hypothetical protein BGZ76_010614 [Entomortierella beljakovae]|nr:hypothetical protein BGZ76_010614 [Entomortierella beljakovae]
MAVPTTTESDSASMSPSIVSPCISTASSFSSSSDINIDIPTEKTESSPKQRSKNGYISRVCFDTLECEDPAQYSLTLQAKTDNWKRTKHTRTFLVGTDLNEHSLNALHWTIENMIDDGDEIIALRVLPIELRDSFAKSGIPSFQGQEIAARAEATKIMEMIRKKNTSKEINIVVEYLVGTIRDSIQHMIRMYEPSMLVVGTRGRSTVKGFLLGSISRYCLNHSPIPVTVVRPANQVKKSKTKVKGIFRRRNSTSQIETGETSVQPQLFYSSPLSRQTSRASVHSDDTASDKSVNIELERKESRSSDHHQPTAAAKASAAKRSLLSPSLIPPNPSESINSSLSFASALLADNTKSTKSIPPPEGMIRLTKSLTSDGTTGSQFGVGKKLGTRRSFGIFFLREKKKQDS